MSLFAKKASDKAGPLGERLASRFLKKLGYKILRRNCRNQFGEIDLIVRDGNEVVFVEVKTRTSSEWGDPAEAVTARKQKLIRLAAERIATRARIRNHPLRFDIVAVLLHKDAEPEIRHYKDAFRM